MLKWFTSLLANLLDTLSSESSSAGASLRASRFAAKREDAPKVQDSGELEAIEPPDPWEDPDED